MTSPARAVARLNAKVQSFQRDLGGPEITREDIALAVALIPTAGASLIGRLKYAGQREYRLGLICELMQELKREGPRKGWTPPDTDEFFRVCNAAVEEATRPPKCNTCKGLGWRFEGLPGPGRPPKDAPKPKRVDCRVCAGEGTRAVTPHWRMREAGIGRKRYLYYWGKYWDRVVMPVLGAYESEFWQTMRRVLHVD